MKCSRLSRADSTPSPTRFNLSSNEVHCVAANNYDAASAGKFHFTERRNTIPLLRAPYLTSSRTLPDVGLPLGQRSQRLVASKVAKGTSERPPVRRRGASPDARWRVALGKRSKRQTTGTCAGRRVSRRGRRFMPFQPVSPLSLEK